MGKYVKMSTWTLSILLVLTGVASGSFFDIAPDSNVLPGADRGGDGELGFDASAAGSASKHVGIDTPNLFNKGDKFDTPEQPIVFQQPPPTTTTTTTTPPPQPHYYPPPPPPPHYRHPPPPPPHRGPPPPPGRPCKRGVDGQQQDPNQVQANLTQNADDKGKDDDRRRAVSQLDQMTDEFRNFLKQNNISLNLTKQDEDLLAQFKKHQQEKLAQKQVRSAPDQPSLHLQNASSHHNATEQGSHEGHDHHSRMAAGMMMSGHGQPEPGQGMGMPGQGMGMQGQGMGMPGQGMGMPGQGMGMPGQGMGMQGQGMMPGQGMGQGMNPMMRSAPEQPALHNQAQPNLTSPEEAERVARSVPNQPLAQNASANATTADADRIARSVPSQPLAQNASANATTAEADRVARSVPSQPLAQNASFQPNATQHEDHNQMGGMPMPGGQMPDGHQMMMRSIPDQQPSPYNPSNLTQPNATSSGDDRVARNAPDQQHPSPLNATAANPQEGHAQDNADLEVNKRAISPKFGGMVDRVMNYFN